MSWSRKCNCNCENVQDFFSKLTSQIKVKDYNNVQGILISNANMYRKYFSEVGKLIVKYNFDGFWKLKNLPVEGRTLVSEIAIEILHEPFSFPNESLLCAIFHWSNFKKADFESVGQRGDAAFFAWMKHLTFALKKDKRNEKYVRIIGKQLGNVNSANLMRLAHGVCLNGPVIHRVETILKEVIAEAEKKKGSKLTMPKGLTLKKRSSIPVRNMNEKIQPPPTIIILDDDDNIEQKKRKRDNINNKRSKRRKLN